MRFKEFVDLGVATWSHAQTKGISPATAFLVLGPPGVGKTSTSYEMARRMTAIRRAVNPDAPEAICEVLDLSSRLPEDIGGIPMPTTGDFSFPVTRYAIQEWLAYLCDPKAYGVLCMDDIAAAAPAVQVAVRQLILDRKVGAARISDGILILATGNRREDKAGASTLPAHFRNSTCILSVELSLDEWCEWYGSQEGLDPVIMAFLRWRPSHFSQLPKEADAMGAFATPRSWTKLGQTYGISKPLGLLLETSKGLVGEGPAIEFMAFVNTRSELVSPFVVLEDPKGALPKPEEALKSPDVSYAMCTGLAEAVVELAKDGKKGVHLKFLQALAWVTRHNRESVALALQYFVTLGGDINDILSVIMANREDKEIIAMADFIREAFAGE